MNKKTEASNYARFLNEISLSESLEISLSKIISVYSTELFLRGYTPAMISDEIAEGYKEWRKITIALRRHIKNNY